MSNKITDVSHKLKAQFAKLDDKRAILRAPELKALYAEIPNLPANQRRDFGQAINTLKQELERMVEDHEAVVASADVMPIDVTAPLDINAKQPQLLSPEVGSRHPLSIEREQVSEIFARMGFEVIDSRQIDDDYHMFGALNFPEGHPARDDYDTFVTHEGLVAPAHTSTMQNRILKENTPPIRSVVVGRVFRNEDLDARHEHTLNQIECVYVDKGINVGHLIATMNEFFNAYYKTNLKIRTQPSYFPFVEPGLEFAASCPFCGGQGCQTCGHEGWIELGGCGMIHPNVLKEGGIDPKKYTGFAWGLGLDRLVMLKYAIEDIRNFQGGKLAFLRQFK